MEVSSVETRLALLELALVTNTTEINNAKKEIVEIREEIDEINLSNVQVKADLAYIREKADETSVKLDEMTEKGNISKVQVIWSSAVFVLGGVGTYLLTLILGG